jgi:TolB-like protein
VRFAAQENEWMSFFAELKRRNVIRVAFAYTVIAWVLAQVAEFAFENFGAPDWVLKSVIVILLLGLPIAIIFAWAFEMTPEGIKREKEVDRSASITPQTGKKLDRVIIAVLAVALMWFAWDKFGSSTEPAPTATASSVSDKSVAVLPFVAMSSGPDDEFFADGMTEEILNSLAQLPELLVTARTSAFSFKGQDIPIQKIAEVLGVQHVVEGSVRRSGDRLRVTAQLIRANDGFHLWSETFDSTSADTIEVQENIAEEIAVALEVVLDENKRDAMRLAGLRDIEAFTFYQKGRDLFERAHGEIPQIEGLRQANVYFEQVIEVVPEYWQVYADHSDLYTHLLNNSVAGIREEGITEAVLADAYATAIADLEAAAQNAPTTRIRYIAELDVAFLSGNWRGLSGRVERALAEPGCLEGNWTPTIVNVLGAAGDYVELSTTILACDPLRTLSWFNLARAKLWAGDSVEALEIAREGMEIAPGAWLTMTLLQTLVSNGLHEEALQVIENDVRDVDLANVFQILVAAHQGDKERSGQLLAEYDENYLGDFFDIIVNAWSGSREAANRRAAEIDEHFFGPMILWQLANWCQCGSPWELEATPNFAAKIKEANITWPPKTPLSFPLKDW